MSQKRPAPNPIVTFLLWGAFIFLGWNLYTNFTGGGSSNDGRNSEEVWEQIVKLNVQGKDLKMAGEINLYNSLLNKEIKVDLNKLEKQVDVGELSEEDLNKQTKELEKELEEKQFYATIIYAQTRFASGIHNDSQPKLEAAYLDLNKLYSKEGKTELWNEREWDVEPYKDELADSRVTGDRLYKSLISHLSIVNKKEKVVGYIPGYDVIDTLVKWTGSNPQFSYWFAALLLAFFVRLAVFPLAQKQFIWGRRMAQLSPYIKEIKEKFTDPKTKQVSDQQAMSVETMALYKKYGMNPFSGCLPLLIQMPLFLIIYRCMLLYKFEFTKGHFLWVQEGATSFLGISIAPNLGERDYLLIIIYGISMIVTTLMTPVSDPANVKQQRMIGIGMALFFSVMMFFWALPSAFITYWKSVV